MTPPGRRTQRDSAPTPEKRHSRGKGRRAGKGLARIGGREYAAHEPLISSVIVAEVPLAGLSFGALGFVLAICYFTWAVTIGSLALGAMPLIIGLPLLVLFLASARGLSLFEGRVVELLLRVRMPRRTQPVAGLEGVGSGTRLGFWKRIGCWLRDVRSWMSLGYLLGNLPVSTFLFSVTITLVVLSAWLLAAPVFYALDMPISQAAPGDGFVLESLLGVESDGKIFLTGATVVPVFLMGLALMTGTLWLMRGLGFVYGRVVQAIQVARPQ